MGRMATAQGHGIDFDSGPVYLEQVWYANVIGAFGTLLVPATLVLCGLNGYGRQFSSQSSQAPARGHGIVFDSGPFYLEQDWNANVIGAIAIYWYQQPWCYVTQRVRGRFSIQSSQARHCHHSYILWRSYQCYTDIAGNRIQWLSVVRTIPWW